MSGITAAERAAMARARELALRGPRGINPQVGAVILAADGRMLAEGWHRGAGTAHAEVDALSRVNPAQARGATAVVTLEPCNHTGRTGPCAAALLSAGIGRVVYGAADPGEASSGGSTRLAEGGVDVHRHGEHEADALIADWLFVQRTGRPRVTVKWAQSLDGRAAAADGTSQWITGPQARADVHRERSAHDAIAVGTGTVLADDPRLTARIEGVDDVPQPIPIVFGERAIPADAAVRQHPRELRTAGHELERELFALAASGIQTLYVEGGPTLASAFIRAGLADRLTVYLAPTLIGGPRTALDDLGVETIDEQRRLTVTRLEQLGNDLLVEATTESEQ
ncbi:bifunctional diaminohydroxyphosphoribosylaminopyrimidine deaminase/5-amino-6-(5-phosphoribosylamino)uracil reductase RibD [Agrococcus sp. ARC_14]|uniref:bifunctional diaminohydroxyphosphoribosylaminopyrimidine deaminase/5-amino-6-(5-phosphoribosylamino)uracil reductase RibD n=1 Tax=Agrococcus sp. ARC_14 TaxID=2919927 RepID=UPI001F064309|nr:bifunctional diaminohydroxyphosphoribosylaminopyrimidine deaminase/5-amino-6-(5-phosphoribosylamino)uracil reductase RibD [Agrococcus sp. ARC_14]MCH1882264.1 bifunctional diaminohydroxyphosphoribosylaminopyrimidine deaminase/5-amino-6-(5-phosphoribosylamino)uracil reductase RibD [Agrococcus sp. ARC_14]